MGCVGRSPLLSKFSCAVTSALCYIQLAKQLLSDIFISKTYGLRESENAIVACPYLQAHEQLLAARQQGLFQSIQP